MKRYIKPNTDIHFVEAQTLMAGTTIDKLDGTTSDGDFTGLGKGQDLDSDLWED